MILDIAFDCLPSSKGAAVHIAAFAQALGAHFGDVVLLTVADSDATVVTDWPGVKHVPLQVKGANLIERVLHFQTLTFEQLNRLNFSKSNPIFHVRSIYEGFPLIRAHLPPGAKIVFEVNGLPSIELKYHYPEVAEDRELLTKLRAQEDALIARADLLVTPSSLTARHLELRGAKDSKIRVIENGVSLPDFTYQAPLRPQVGCRLEVLYAGTLSAWQGVETALSATQLYLRDAPMRLTIVGPGKSAVRRALETQVAKLGIEEHVNILSPVSQQELGRLHHLNHVVVAPLMPTERNQVQGCCPLKVLEAMASGTPLLASDLEVVSSLARSEQEALLTRAGSAKALKDGMVRLRDDLALRKQLSENARARIEKYYTWPVAQARLVEAYRDLKGTQVSRRELSNAASSFSSRLPS